MITDLLDDKLIKEAQAILGKKCNLKNQQVNLQKKDCFFSIKDMSIDISRNIINKEIILDLSKFAKQSKIRNSIKDLFDNNYKSPTENKKVSFLFERNNKELMAKKQKKLFNLHDKIKAQPQQRLTRKPIKNLIHIGIGGSILGMQAISQALKDFHDKKLKIYYVSSPDLSDIQDALNECNLSETAFIFASKSFSTREVLLNYIYVKGLLSSFLDDKYDIADHFYAITANKSLAVSRGFKSSNILTFSNTIPGRFSLSSEVSLCLLLELGKKNYSNFIKGIYFMDNHFRKNKIEENIPIIMALLTIWNTNYLNINNNCVSGYSYRLRSMFNFIQQIEMESNGKSVSIMNQKLHYDTSPFMFGLQGTESQHSFFQMIHQGTHRLSLDFIGVINTKHSKESDRFILSNLIAQANLCYEGKTKKQIYENINGGNPSNIILLDSITPFNIGLLTAMYENKVVAEGLLWNINSFDQWGVEEGKKLSSSLMNELGSKKKTRSSSYLLNHIKRKIKK